MEKLIAERLSKLRRERMNESTEYSNISISDLKKKVESRLNYQLSNYETGIYVEDITILEENAEEISVKVNYSVSIKLPVPGSEDEYEYDKEFRTRNMTLSKEELE